MNAETKPDEQDSAAVRFIKAPSKPQPVGFHLTGRGGPDGVVIIKSARACLRKDARDSQTVVNVPNECIHQVLELVLATAAPSSLKILCHDQLDHVFVGLSAFLPHEALGTTRAHAQIVDADEVLTAAVVDVLSPQAVLQEVSSVTEIER